MKVNVALPSPITDLTAFFARTEQTHANPAALNGTSVKCKRDDLIHPIVSGNKWRKLSGSIKLVIRGEHQHVMSFGGAHSNHLHALSYACANNISCSAIIRGDYREHLTPTLLDMQAWGTTLHFVTNADYKKRADKLYVKQKMKQLGADYTIPEGGSNTQCLLGVSEILHELIIQAPGTSHIVLPVASGGTMAGLLSSTTMPGVKLVGVGVLKGEGYLENLVLDLLGPKFDQESSKVWEVCHQFHHGGYAKTSPELAAFVSAFNHYHLGDVDAKGIAIEPVYSGKCFYALQHLFQTHYFPPGSNVVILHTGGLQGARSQASATRLC